VDVMLLPYSAPLIGKTAKKLLDGRLMCKPSLIGTIKLKRLAAPVGKRIALRNTFK